MVTETKDGLVDEEPLDPRIQFELERLNASAVLVNKLENEISVAATKLREDYYNCNVRLELYVKKYGYAIERARLYYELRRETKEMYERVISATAQYDRSVSVLATAQEIVDVAEHQCISRKLKFDEAWQEMLNAAIMKVSKAEEEVTRCTAIKESTERFYHQLLTQTKKSYKVNKKFIKKSRPYFDAMIDYNNILTAQQRVIKELQHDVSVAKSSYSECMANLEMISNDIHFKRGEKLQQHETNPSICSLGEAQEVLAGSGGSNGEVCSRSNSSSENLSEMHISTCLQKRSCCEACEELHSRNSEELRVTSNSCTNSLSDSLSDIRKLNGFDDFLERTVSIPDVPKDTGTPTYDSFSDCSSDTDSSVLDDQSLASAMSYQNFEKLMESSTMSKESRLPGSYDTLPAKLSAYQDHYAILKQNTLRRGCATSDLQRIIDRSSFRRRVEQND